MIYSREKIDLPNVTWSNTNPQDDLAAIQDALPKDFEMGQLDGDTTEIGSWETGDNSFLCCRASTTKGWFVLVSEVTLGPTGGDEGK
ncbi:MAG: hypothetical protein A2V70_15235 [Planctomycetes bacterium RBG_13_63_9]|nr:MAG: hypothetical protein A2V70_15235 [Planctomycetes bacterium RBG_13_63_9]